MPSLGKNKERVVTGFKKWYFTPILSQCILIASSSQLSDAIEYPSLHEKSKTLKDKAQPSYHICVANSATSQKNAEGEKNPETHVTTLFANIQIFCGPSDSEK